MLAANVGAIAKISPVSMSLPRLGRGKIRLGFVPLTDCAPIVMARELGLFEKHSLDVELSREIGWATIRDKVIYRELDAAPAPAGMLVTVAAGLGGLAAECLTGLVLNLHGNAITLSQRLWKSGVRDGATLRNFVRNGRRPLTFGTVYQWSSHTVLLRLWLKEHGVDPETEVEMVVVPPSQMVPHLRAGHIDGFCAGEPWNSLAVMSGAGWVVARSAQLAPLHPEKVLMVRRDFAERADGEHVRLIAALLEAARFCDDAANRERIAETLARPEYVGASPEAIRRSMRGVYDYGNDRVEPCAGFNIFARDNASEPDEGKARWVTQSLIASGLATARQLPPRVAQRCFRPDIFARAAKLVNPSSISSAA
jgi:ABC-type nitrate/sulfonate/bicarbonate transport system substrate-binding protein